jgi:hypothetical protein
MNPNKHSPLGCDAIHAAGVFDRWFEGVGYQNGEFFDNEGAKTLLFVAAFFSKQRTFAQTGSGQTERKAAKRRWRFLLGVNCTGYPWPKEQCMTRTDNASVGAGYLTSELGNRSIAWLRELEETDDDRPWLVYWATHAPHTAATPPAWYSTQHIDECNPDGKGIVAPRLPNWNFSGMAPIASWVRPFNWTVRKNASFVTEQMMYSRFRGALAAPCSGHGALVAVVRVRGAVVIAAALSQLGLLKGLARQRVEPRR